MGNPVSEKYARMASVDQYLMNSDAEIAMARSAAPAAITQDATILVLEKGGYRIVLNGKNGFTCLVERSWMSPFDSPEFWNPKIRGPICYNRPSVRTVLPYTLNRTKLIFAGFSKAQVHESISRASGTELQTPEAGAMSYMMSKIGYLGDSAGNWRPHLMFHVPGSANDTWGANRPGSPVLFDKDSHDVPEPETIFMIPVPYWSDGSKAPQ